MRSCLIEVHHIRFEDTLELSLMKDQQVVEAFLPHTPQEALTDRIGSGSVVRGLENLDATGGCYSDETGSEFAIMIANEILRHLSIRSCLPQLLCSPRVARRSCHAHVDHFPRLHAIQ